MKKLSNRLPSCFSKLLAERVNHQKKAKLFRKNIAIDSRKGAYLNIEGKNYLNFSSNDYLGLSTAKEVKKSFIKGVKQYGFGSGSSVAISGYFKPQRELEEKFAQFLQRERALFFHSGYMANLGTISALSNRDDIVFSDRLSHASLLDGILLSRAKQFRFQHNNIQHLETSLNQHINKKRIIITETLFSMRGDIAPLDKIANIAKKHSSFLIVDDAHAIGVIGKKGGGAVDYFNLSEESLPCLITPLGKAMGGAGAIISGKKIVVEAVAQFARTYRYTTAAPPAISLANLKALELLQKELWRREKLLEIVDYLIKEAKKEGIELLSNDRTPIKMILMGDNQKVQQIQSKLFEKGFFVAAIRPPTVPTKSAVIRLSLNIYHTKEMIKKLLQALTLTIKECN